MSVDWGFASQVGGVGFGMVFLLLVILAAVVWLLGMVLGKGKMDKGKTANKKEGA